MKQTKKEIIKDMLVKAIDSDEQHDLLNCKELIKLDLCDGADEKIAFIKELHSNSPKTRTVLTNKTYLLLVAYKHSASRLTDYGKHFSDMQTNIIKRACRKAAVYTQLENDSFKLYNTINRKYLHPEWPTYGEYRWGSWC